jgi:hypothetical protein
MQLANGQRTSLPVGDLPRPVAEHLGCHPAIVYLGSKEFAKIVRKHSELKVAEFQQLPFAISKGKYLQDEARPRSATVIYRSNEDRRLYLVGIKSAGRGSEVWVSTYYRIDEISATRRERKGAVLWLPTGK